MKGKPPSSAAPARLSTEDEIRHATGSGPRLAPEFSRENGLFWQALTDAGVLADLSADELQFLLNLAERDTRSLN
jgi:hypothetical protein